MFLNTWDVQLEISLVSTHVNLIGMSLHMKNWEKNWLIHWFGMTELNKTLRRMCGRKIADEIL